MIYDIMPVDNYKGNNLSTQFDFDFYIENKDQLKVYLFKENKTKVELEYNVDYSINEFKNKNGSFITFPLPGSDYGVLNDKEEISISLTLPISQETQFNNSSLLNFESLEYALDYLTRLIQILARKVSLCVKVEECSKTTPDELINTISLSTNSAIGAANSANEKLNKIIEQKEKIETYKEEIETINDEIQKEKEKFDSIDVLAKNHDTLAKIKLNKDHSNDTAPYIIDTYRNGSSWYRIYSDGWCEQGGKVINGGTVNTVSLLKQYNLMGDVSITACANWNDINPPAIGVGYSNKSILLTTSQPGLNIYWITAGYLAQGEY